MFLKIFGLVLIAAGLVMIMKTEWLLENFGRVEWAEQKFSGGTRFFLKAGGLIVIFLGLTMIFDIFGGIVVWFFSPLLPKK